MSAPFSSVAAERLAAHCTPHERVLGLSRLPPIGTTFYFRYWPIAEMPAAARHGRLLAVNLPAASPFVNPDSAHHGPRRASGGASIIPPDATASAAIRGPARRSAASRSMRRRAAPLDVSRRSARTDAGGAIGREAVDAATAASNIMTDPAKAARRSTATPSEMFEMPARFQRFRFCRF
jgi:hypothetical protein